MSPKISPKNPPKSQKPKKSPRPGSNIKKNRKGNAFFVFRTLLNSDNTRMEDHSITASREWKKLRKDQKRIYYEIYELVANKYTIDNNANGLPFFSLQYNPNIVKEENTELNYSRVKEIYDMLVDRKDSTSSPDTNTNQVVNYAINYDQQFISDILCLEFNSYNPYLYDLNLIDQNYSSE
ncbi:hypothetical protein Glove_340g19 [Diversispora epigaea]|uniref:Uncharacterized protein n=1 Tax=Diversispora epigaea TaxID=1348612 RepID=A0A397HH67_9GLOM|nr:hypothetical protein Glove_340g19 [Diversispora epigaea]